VGMAHGLLLKQNFTNHSRQPIGRRNPSEMKYISIEEMMVPLKDCDRLVETATLLDAVEAIDKAFSRPHPGRLPHRTLLVLGVEGGVVGLVGYLDVLRGLEPKYRDLIGQQGMAHL